MEPDLRLSPAVLAAWVGIPLLVPGWSAAEPLSRPSSAEIQAIERSVVLPPGAEPLRAFARHYASVIQDGRRVIRGIYVLEGEARVIVTTADALPRVLDGGCGVVTVEYDVLEAAFLLVMCNGDA